MAPGFWELVSPRPAQEPKARILWASPAPSTQVQLWSQGTRSARSELWARRAPCEIPFTCPSARQSGCARPCARLLCRCRSRRGGDPAAPPWGRSKWSGRTSLGRYAPGAASGRHTCQAAERRAGSAGQEGRTGRRRDQGSCGCRRLLNWHQLQPGPAPAFPGDHLPPAGRAQGLAPCLLDTNRISSLELAQAPVGVVFLSSAGSRGCGLSPLCVRF